jgi:hypothetical protein
MRTLKRIAAIALLLALSATTSAGELMAPGKMDLLPDGQLVPKGPLLAWKCDEPKLMLKMRVLQIGERIVITDANLKPTPVYAVGVEPQDGRPTVVIDSRITCHAPAGAKVI